MLGKNHSSEAKMKISKGVSGKANGSYAKFKYFNPNDFNDSVKVSENERPPGWITATEKAAIIQQRVRQKLIDEDRYTGKKWYNDGNKQFLLLPENAFGLQTGRLKQRKLSK